MNIRETVVQTAKKAYADKLFAATSGNLSIYDRENGRMYITPGSYPYEIMTAEDIMVIDLEGNVLEGVHAPSSEWRIHAQVYRDKPEVNAIVHTHSPYATAFAINHLPIAAVSFEMPYFLGGDVPVARAALEAGDDPDSVREALRTAVPTYHSPEEVNRAAEQAEEMRAARTGLSA